MPNETGALPAGVLPAFFFLIFYHTPFCKIQFSLSPASHIRHITLILFMICEALNLLLRIDKMHITILHQKKVRIYKGKTEAEKFLFLYLTIS